jgi:hypothetical protein
LRRRGHNEYRLPFAFGVVIRDLGGIGQRQWIKEDGRKKWEKAIVYEQEAFLKSAANRRQMWKVEAQTRHAV